VEAETMDEVKEVVFNQIRRLGHVKSMITLITYGEFVAGPRPTPTSGTPRYVRSPAT